MIFSETINHLRVLGMGNFLKRVCYRLELRWFTRSLIFVKLDLETMPDDFKGMHGFHLATLSEIQNEPNYADGWFSRQKAIHRLREGHHLFIFRQDESNACFVWSEERTASIDWLDLWFPIPDDVIYDTGLYTVPAMRGKGIGLRLHREVALYWKSRGFKHIFGVIDPRNVASIDLHHKLGFKEYQTVNYKRYAFLRYYCAQKVHSRERRRWLSVFRSPESIWKAFWAF